MSRLIVRPRGRAGGSAWVRGTRRAHEVWAVAATAAGGQYREHAQRSACAAKARQPGDVQPTAMGAGLGSPSPGRGPCTAHVQYLIAW